MNFNLSEIKIEKLAGHDLDRFTGLIALFADVFEMPAFTIPESQYLNKLLNRNEFIVFVAAIENKVVGGLTAYTLDQYYSKKPLAYIYDLAVSREYQRQGIGKKLIKELNRYCSENGFEEVFVQADKVDDNAIDFYRSTSPTDEEQVVHFYYKFDKEIY